MVSNTNLLIEYYLILYCFLFIVWHLAWKHISNLTSTAVPMHIGQMSVLAENVGLILIYEGAGASLVQPPFEGYQQHKRMNLNVKKNDILGTRSLQVCPPSLIWDEQAVQQEAGGTHLKCWHCKGKLGAHT